MLDFLSQNSLYIVLVIVLIVWIGLYTYLFRLDRRIERLEGKSKK